MTDIKKIRLNINDMDKKIFKDEDLEMMLEDEGSVNGATARALEIMAFKLESGLIKEYKRGDVSMAKTTLLELAKYYREKDLNSSSFFVVPQDMDLH